MNSLKYVLFSALFLVGALFVVAPHSVSAQTDAGAQNSSVSLVNPLGGNCSGGNCLMNFLQSILDFVVRIGTVVIVLMVVFVGYKFVVAQGAPAKIEEARTMLLWTIVGALILLGAKAIALAIQATVTAIGG